MEPSGEKLDQTSREFPASDEDVSFGDEDDFEDEEEVEEEEEEEIEPKLTYERIGNGITQILKSDAFSCVAVHQKFIALGTHSGRIHIIDHQGNLICNQIHLHHSSVNQISIDEKGEYLASCSDDQTVIRGLYTKATNTIYKSERPLHSVAIDPQFAKPGLGYRYVTGCDIVKLHSKGFLVGYKPKVLQPSYEGKVLNIRWNGQFIAWANEQNVRIYDSEEDAIITLIRRDQESPYRPDIYKCNLCWKDDYTLLLGWGDSIKVCHIKERSRPELDRGVPLPRLYVEIVSMFQLREHCCAGIGFLEENLVSLCVTKESVLSAVGPAGQLAEPPSPASRLLLRPQLQVIEPLALDYGEISSDILSPRGYEEYRCSDYHLEFIAEDTMFLIVCPKDVILAKPREDDDHISWLLDRERYEEAIESAKNSRSLKKHSLYGIGKQYLDHLIAESDVDPDGIQKAAQVCVSVFGQDVKAWQEQVDRFKSIKKLRVLAPYLPKGPNLRLDASNYEEVLRDFLQNDPQGLLDTIRQWPSSIYSVSNIVEDILERLSKDSKNQLLLEALAELYTKQGKHEGAINIYLEIGQKESSDRVFDLIRLHGLHSILQDKLVILMQLNAEEGARLLYEHQDKIPLEYVVSKLKQDGHPRLLWAYLNCVVQKDTELCAPYHDLMVDLYAQFAPKKLMTFLRQSTNYSLENALKKCTERGLIHEVVFLLGRMGNTKEALEYITQSLDDIDYAIEFCKENADTELWEDLIRYSMTKPEFIRALLQNISTHIPDPIGLIQRIPDSIEIPGLMPALVKILSDYEIQISLEEDCRKILVADCFALLERLVSLQKRGILVSDDQTCEACGSKIIAGRSALNLTSSPLGEIVVFNCKHVFHEGCLPSSASGQKEQYVCNTCSSATRKKPFS